MAHPAHYREAHPLIFVMTHWINLISIVALTIFSGFYIHYPFLPRDSWVWRGACTSSSCSCSSSTLTFRIIASFIVKSATRLGRARSTRTSRTGCRRSSTATAVPWLKYYLFLKKEHPIGAKYGVLQKIAYLPPSRSRWRRPTRASPSGARRWTGRSSSRHRRRRWADGDADHPLLHHVGVHPVHGHPRLPGEHRRRDPSRLIFAWKETKAFSSTPRARSSAERDH
jgi:hypothetical protein